MKRNSSILLLVLLLGCFACAQTNQTPKEGDRAPDFSVRTDQGRRVTLRSFGGNLLVVNYESPNFLAPRR